MTTPPVILEDVELGPACQKLNARRLRFAAALVFEVPAGPNAAIAAGTIAGYADSTARSLARDKSIIAAVEELARQRLVLDVPLALDTLREAMGDRYGKDKLKAAQILLDRVLPTKQEVKLTSETVDRTQETLNHLAHMIEIGVSHDVLVREFGEFGLAHYKKLLEAQKADQSKVIEGEFKVVTDDATSPAEPAEPIPPVEPAEDETLDDLL